MLYAESNVFDNSFNRWIDRKETVMILVILENLLMIKNKNNNNKNNKSLISFIQSCSKVLPKKVSGFDASDFVKKADSATLASDLDDQVLIN